MFLKCVVVTEIMGKRWKSISSAGNTKKGVESMARDWCPRQRMEQRLKVVVGTRRRAARERLFLLLAYDLIARRARAGVGTELGEKLANQINEA